MRLAIGPTSKGEGLRPEALSGTGTRRRSLRPLTRAVYRTGQALHALRPRFDGLDTSLPARVLPPEGLLLFEAMEARDRRHALAVARRLREAGVDAPAVLAAALLHDCGKGAVPIWLRVAKVLAPSLVRAAARDGRGWRGAAHRLAHHPEIGALLAEAAGLPAASVRLISGRILPQERHHLEALQRADDAS